MDRHNDSAQATQLLQLAQRCARQVSFTWELESDGLHFGSEAHEFLAPGLLNDVRTGASLLDRMDPADRAPLRDAIVHTLKGNGNGKAGAGVYEALVRLRSGGQRWHWIAMRGNVTATDAAGRGTRISGVLVDETVRETERREAVRMRNLFAMLGAVNKAVAHASQRQSLLEQLCQVAVTHGQFALAWVSLCDTAERTVVAYAQAGAPADYPPRVAAAASVRAVGSEGLNGIVMRLGRAQVHSDLASAHPRPDWAPHALATGFRSVGGFPLFEGGQPIGVLLLYSCEAHQFDPAMVSLLEGLSSDVSNALDHLAIKRQQADTHRQLFEANRQFQTAMTTSLDGMLVVERDGHIVEMNPAAFSLLGCHAGSAAPNLFTAFTPARYRAARKTQVRRLLSGVNADGAWPSVAGDAQRRIDTFMRRVDGTEVPVELVLTPLEQGPSGRLMLMVRDLTAMLAQRDQLIQSARRFEQLIENSPDGMMVHVQGRILLANSKLREMLAVADPADMLKLRLIDITHPADHPVLRRRMEEQRRGKGSNEVLEVRLLRSDGRPIHVDLLASDTTFEGQPARQLVLRDISERKRLESLQASQQVVLALIAARKPLSEVLLQVARSIENNALGVHCCVYVADESGASFLAGHSPSVPAEVLQAQDFRCIAGDSPSVISRAAHARLPVFVTDVEADVASGPVRELRRKMGSKAVGGWPLLSLSGELMGVIYLSLPHVGMPRPEVLQLVTEYSDLTAVAIDNDRQAARIHHLAHHDALTGLPNRAMFKELLDQAIGRARRRGGMLAAMFIDLDRFKLINDTFGHDAGDAVLCETATRMQQALREGDRVARMGGDEFFVLVDDMASADTCAGVAQRVLELLALPIPVGDVEHELSASIGIAVFPRDGGDSDSLLKHADIAMYRAKQAGRNGYSFFAEADNLHTTARFTLQAQLRRALQRREFVLHYQPKVDLRSGHICGVEALVRWQHPERGLVMPGEFIAVAEESGLIVALGRQVMEMAFADVPALRAAGAGNAAPMGIAVNLSAVQLGAPAFIDEVDDLLARTGLPASAIEFEITESMLMRQPEQARAVIESLRSRGFTFSIDDFGTGYSSLTYLKKFPVQCVKVDRSFVKDIPGDGSDLAITQAIVAMAHSLGLYVVAEGVETPEQLNALRQMGCDQYQGYYFSKPVTLEHVLALMQLPRVG